MDQNSLWSHETVLAAEPGSAAKARAFVLQHLAEHRLLYLVDDVRMVASELATNAVLHARTAFTAAPWPANWTARPLAPPLSRGRR